eukprot:2108380-Rhodomonas_salina.1
MRKGSSLGDLPAASLSVVIDCAMVLFSEPIEVTCERMCSQKPAAIGEALGEGKVDRCLPSEEEEESAQTAPEHSACLQLLQVRGGNLGGIPAYKLTWSPHDVCPLHTAVPARTPANLACPRKACWRLLVAALCVSHGMLSLSSPLHRRMFTTNSLCPGGSSRSGAKRSQVLRTNATRLKWSCHLTM